MACHVRKEFRNPCAALAVLPEFERRFQQRTDLIGKKSRRFIEALQFLAITLRQLRFIVPGIDLAGPSMNSQITDFALAGKCAGFGARGL